MFDRIAPRYDRMNRLLTIRMDQGWRRRVVRGLRVGPGDFVLDIACGTGDFAGFARAAGAEVVGVDFSMGMLRAARERHGGDIQLVCGDALRFPFADGVFTVALSGFALRNFVDIGPAIREAARVLAPGGRLGLLEVDRPGWRAMRAAHSLYFDRMVPRIGGWLSDRRAYAYLPQSTTYLPPEPELLAEIAAAGFERVRKRSFLFGSIQAIVAVRA